MTAATRRYICQLGERENVDQVFLVADKQLRANRNGNLYLQLRLTDRSGSLTGMLWNANDQICRSFESGDYIRVQGTTQLYNGALQMIVTRIDRTDASTINESDFVTFSTAQIDSMAEQVRTLLRSMQNHHLRNIAECFLLDDDFMAALTCAPAGIKNHHAYRGGLLEHVLHLMKVVDVVAPLYPQLDRDLLLMGAFVHDMGKIRELSYERELAYSDEGQLIGHLVIAASILETKAAEASRLAGEEFPRPLLLQLQHMVISHHGEYEYGSPKLPMTLEAIALNLLDTLDARIHNITQLIREDANTDSPWTPFISQLGRKIFKGHLGSAADPTAEF